MLFRCFYLPKVWFKVVTVTHPQTLRYQYSHWQSCRHHVNRPHTIIKLACRSMNCFKRNIGNSISPLNLSQFSSLAMLAWHVCSATVYKIMFRHLPIISTQSLKPCQYRKLPGAVRLSRSQNSRPQQNRQYGEGPPHIHHHPAGKWPKTQNLPETIYSWKSPKWKKLINF